VVVFEVGNKGDVPGRFLDLLKTIRPIQPRDISNTRRAILLLLGGEGRDEGEHTNHYSVSLLQPAVRRGIFVANRFS
jgi:hypothetical protein